MATYGKYYAVRDAGTPSRLSRVHQTDPHRLEGLEDALEDTRFRSYDARPIVVVVLDNRHSRVIRRYEHGRGVPVTGTASGQEGQRHRVPCRPMTPALPVDESAPTCHPVRAIADGLVSRGRLVAVFARLANSRGGRGSVSLYGCCEWGQHPECRALGPLSTQGR